MFSYESFCPFGCDVPQRCLPESTLHSWASDTEVGGSERNTARNIKKYFTVGASSKTPA